VPAHTSSKTNAKGYFQFYNVYQLTGLAYLLLRTLPVTKRCEEDYFDAEKLIIEAQK